VPGVVAALKAHNNISLPRVKINDLSFTLVTPLGAYHCNISHESFFLPFHPVTQNGPQCFSQPVRLMPKIAHIA
jgi:hypothetical protein